MSDLVQRTLVALRNLITAVEDEGDGEYGIGYWLDCRTAEAHDVLREWDRTWYGQRNNEKEPTEQRTTEER